MIWVYFIVTSIFMFIGGLLVGKYHFRKKEDKPVGVLKIIEEWNQGRDYEPQDPYFFLELEELPWKLTDKKTVAFRVDYKRIDPSSTQKKHGV